MGVSIIWQIGGIYVVFQTMFFALLCAVMLAPACARKSEPPAATSSALHSADDGAFKYTITTDLDTQKDNIEILVGMNTVNGQYPVKYDLDCEGDGDFEYKDLTDNKKCIYKKNSGKHQIWVRGEISAMILCARRPDGVNCEPDLSDDKNKELLCIAPVGLDDSKDAVISIDSWGNVAWKSMEGFAAICTALEKIPEDNPDLRQVKSMNWMFSGATSFNQPLEKWDVSKVTDMEGMFSGAKSFNQPLEKWDVSKVTNMAGMIFGALLFNQPLEKWNVSNVTDMFRMFSVAKSFNQPLEAWNVSNVTDMEAMFSGASSFNQPLEKWNVSKVTNMNEMFKDAKAFSHYPKSWVIPEDNSEDMFTGAIVEAEAKKKTMLQMV